MNDLVKIRNELSHEDFYRNIFDAVKNEIDSELLNSFLLHNHALIIYSSNNRLNGILSWFKHLWYESFGKIKINLYFEDYSSMFHSSSQYYLSHTNDNYVIMQLYSEEDELNYLKENFTSFLPHAKLLKIQVEQNAISLIKVLVKIIAFISHLGEFFDIDILSQEHIDGYKKRLIERFL